MADGEIEVAVRAEGVDDAAADMGGDGEGGGTAGAGDGDSGGLRTAIRGGIIGGLISTLLGPLLEVLEPITKILQAFVAPVAVLLLRILAPVLRFFLRLLPVYLDKFENFENLISKVLIALNPLFIFLPSIVNFVSKLPGKLDTLRQNLGEKLRNLPGKIRSKLETIREKIVEAVQNLPSKIKAALFGGGQDGGISEQGFGDGAGGEPTTAEQISEETGLPEPVSRIINISGGLAPLISEITSNANYDILE